MGNKKNNCFFKTKKEWAKYRWEFMRRDPDFIKAYDELLNLFGHFKNGEVIEEELQKAVKNFSKEFNIIPSGSLIDRKKSYDELEQEFGKESLIFAFLNRNMGNAVWMVSQYGGNPVPKDHLLIEIDFSEVNSLTALRDIINLYVDLEWKSFLSKHPEREKTKKLRPSDFDIIIQVGDLKKENKQISCRMLAERCFLDDLDPDSRKKKVTQHLARYHELTGGGWRDFRFP
jgi:hypothetical protein